MMLPRRPHPRFLGPWAWFFILLAALGALVAWLASGSGRLPDDHAGGARLLQGVLLAALIGAGILHGRRMGLKTTLGAAFIWLALGAGLVLAYSYRFEAERAWNRITAELVPDRIRAAQGAIRVRRADDGHFYMRVLVNGTEVRFMVDTGATTTVLDPRDAARVGFDPRQLRFNETFRTANGTVRGARVSLARIAFGPVEFRDVRASVNGAPLGTSLLGISTLERFRAWRVEDGTLTLEY
jgi:aspartyl protease family protein